MQSETPGNHQIMQSMVRADNIIDTLIAQSCEAAPDAHVKRRLNPQVITRHTIDDLCIALAATSGKIDGIAKSIEALQRGHNKLTSSSEVMSALAGFKKQN